MRRRRRNWRACESAKPLETREPRRRSSGPRGAIRCLWWRACGPGLQSTRVHAVIAARLAQLTPASYELAGLASVVGRPFSFELLEKATDWDEAAFRRRWTNCGGGASSKAGSLRVRFHARPAARSGLRGTEPGAQRYLHRRVARALAEVHVRTISKAGTGRLPRISNRPEWRKRRSSTTGGRLPMRGSAMRIRKPRTCCRRALALCRGFSESDRRLKQELDLLVTLGPALVTTEGYSAPEVGETYDRALELSRRLDDRNIFVILSGAWVFHVVRGDLEKARQFSLDFLKAGGTGADARADAGGQFPAGKQFVSFGPPGRVAAPYDGGHSHAHAVRRNPSWRCSPGRYRCVLPFVIWPIWRGTGEDEAQAVDDHAAEAIAAARRMRHPFSQAIALDYAAMLHVFRGESRAALERGTEAVELCSRHGFAYYLAMANILTGWARAAEGDRSRRPGATSRGLEGMRGLGAELRLPFYFALLAETLGRAGLVGEALASLSTGFAFASKNGEEWAVAELHRAQGELLAARRKDGGGARQLSSAVSRQRGGRVRWRSSENCRFWWRNGCNRRYRTLLERPAAKWTYTGG